jgi:hypothetical protein
MNVITVCEPIVKVKKSTFKLQTSSRFTTSASATYPLTFFKNSRSEMLFQFSDMHKDLKKS